MDEHVLISGRGACSSHMTAMYHIVKWNVEIMLNNVCIAGEPTLGNRKCKYPR